MTYIISGNKYTGGTQEPLETYSEAPDVHLSPSSKHMTSVSVGGMVLTASKQYVCKCVAVSMQAY